MAQIVKDHNGETITVGSRVRVLALGGAWLDYLEADEKKDVLSLVGEILKVEEIDEYGQAWVLKSWDRGSGLAQSHSVALSSVEMEVVV